jgi:ABC-type Fe3+/spermidine/putrescine transport system ATPase subunit
MALALENVRKAYGALAVLPAFSLEIGNGEFLTLLGPSGSGKTTVLKLIGGFVAADGGRILFEGADVTRLPANRRPFNTVFQDYALFPHMTVAQNAGYGPLVQRRDPARSRKLVDETLEIVGLSALRDRYPAQLSGGQKQRVALARAIVCEPKVILLDEPLAALDASLRRQMQLFLKRIQRQIRTTFVFVTHDQDEAITMSDRIVVMNQGRIEQQGTPKELYYRPATRFVAGFFGDNNLIPGRLLAGAPSVETPLGPLLYGFAAPGLKPGDDVLLSIRPEMLVPTPQGRIAAQVEEVVFGGANTRLLLHAVDAPAIKLDLQFAADARAAVPAVGDRINLDYDPANAVVVPAA